MARARKTVDVELVRETANRVLSRPTYTNLDVVGDSFRNGVAALLETILMETGNYKGFQYTDGSNGEENRSYRYYH